MNKQIVLTLCLVAYSIISLAQSRFSTVITDQDGQPLPGASVVIKGTNNGATSDANGQVTLANVPDGLQTLVVSYIGYENQEVALTFPLGGNGPANISLEPSEDQLDEIVIEATRANKTVANLPTRTEVLTEEIDEAASMEPSRIAHLITHSTGIQVQTTSASSNGSVVRIQGLNGRYTQMLKDGFPLYGGFSGSLDVLQIPPLDLRQVEYVKGSASTLYGGGAIGGLINLLSKRPVNDESLLHVNFSNIGAKDFNVYTSQKFGKFGFTNLATLHMHSPFDANNDGFSDVPDISKFNFNPKLFYYPDERSEVYLGATISNERRVGGDMGLIDNELPGVSNFYLDDQESKRYTTQLQYKRDLTSTSSITFKNSISIFDRVIQIRQNSFGLSSTFGGKQTSTFSELNYSTSRPNQDLIVGLNVYSDDFREQELVAPIRRDQLHFTVGAFANHLWNVNEQLALESGLRVDRASAESRISRNQGEFFALPRISALYRATEKLSIRLGSGLGYRMPTIFNEEAEPFGYENVQPVDFNRVDPERSLGANLDFKYQTTLNSSNMLLTINQLFYYNQIDNPILLDPMLPGAPTFINAADFLKSRGFETQVKLTVSKFTWFLGYTYTDAFIEATGTESELILTPQHSIKGDLLFVEDGVWRIGWDYEFKSGQLLSTGRRSQTLFTTGVVVERTVDNFILFVNAENFTDRRQTRFETTITAPFNTPQFTDIWAPLDGFFLNAGFKLKL